MDPNETLRAFLLCCDKAALADPQLREAYREDALEHLANLQEWIAAGGFLPSVRPVTYQLSPNEHQLFQVGK